jgi:hypothetical protein
LDGMEELPEGHKTVVNETLEKGKVIEPPEPPAPALKAKKTRKTKKKTSDDDSDTDTPTTKRKSKVTGEREDQVAHDDTTESAVRESIKEEDTDRGNAMEDAMGGSTKEESAESHKKSMIKAEMKSEDGEMEVHAVAEANVDDETPKSKPKPRLKQNRRPKAEARSDHQMISMMTAKSLSTCQGRPEVGRYLCSGQRVPSSSALRTTLTVCVSKLTDDGKFKGCNGFDKTPQSGKYGKYTNMEDVSTVFL